MESKPKITGDEDNEIKWSSIPLTIQMMFNPREADKNKGNFNKWLFESPVTASVKFDGTNVGKDEDGTMYGRNKLIADSAKSYQKTTLDGVNAVDSAKIKAKVMEVSGLDSATVDKFVVYGELMCNKDLYDYKEKNLGGGYQIFGAMIKPVDENAMNQIMEKLTKAGFAVGVRGGSDEEEEQDESTTFMKKVMLMMNETWLDLIKGMGYPTVPVAGKFGSFYELLNENFEWMINGNGEGLILVQQGENDATISKWKIGAEANSSNVKMLEFVQDLIQKEKDIFGENQEKAVEVFDKLLQIQASKKQLNAPKKAEPKAKGQKGGNKKVLTPEEQAQYDEAIKSAKTKFDHADTYFEKNFKGMQEYCKLIADECLNDITVDKNDKNAMKAHNDIVQNIIKEEFAAFMKAKKGK